MTTNMVFYKKDSLSFWKKEEKKGKNGHKRPKTAILGQIQSYLGQIQSYLGQIQSY